MIDEETKEAILAESAGKGKAKQVADELPAYMNLGPRKRYTRAERKARKAKRKRAKKSRMSKKKKKR